MELKNRVYLGLVKMENKFSNFQNFNFINYQHRSVSILTTSQAAVSL